MVLFNLFEFRTILFLVRRNNYAAFFTLKARERQRERESEKCALCVNFFSDKTKYSLSVNTPNGHYYSNALTQCDRKRIKYRLKNPIQTTDIFSC